MKYIEIHRNTLLLVVFLLLFSIFSHANAATLFLSPANGSYSVGQTFSVSVYVSSSDQAMNAVSVNISFPSNLLQVVSLSKTNSIITNWVQEPSFSNTSGTINLEGIVLNPGYQGNSGRIITITFKAKSAGTAEVVFTSSSVLANDGLGTNILTNMGKASYVIENPIETPVAPQAETPSKTIGTPHAPEIISSTHPDSNKWYQSTIAKFSWQIGPDIISDSVSIDKNPRTVPQTVFTPPIISKEISDLSEGVWYLHVQLRNSYGWGDVSHFRFQIDTTPPEPFNIQVDNNNDPTNPQPILKFKADDALSGIDHYEIKIGEMSTIKVSPEEMPNDSYKLPITPPGQYTVIIRALDKAGNYSVSVTNLNILPIESPIITDYPQRLEPGNPLIVKGTSNVCHHVTLFVQNERKEIITSDGECKDGHWTVILNQTLPNGVYSIWAKAIDFRGASSNPTNLKQIIVSPPVFIQIGNILIPYLSVIITLISLIVLMILIILYGRKKINDLKRAINREAIEAEEALYQSFDILRREVAKQVAKLDGKPGLSPKEKELNSELKDALNRAEAIIEKEIKDIRKQL